MFEIITDPKTIKPKKKHKVIFHVFYLFFSYTRHRHKIYTGFLVPDFEYFQIGLDER